MLLNFHYAKKETIEAHTKSCFTAQTPPHFYAKRSGKQGIEQIPEQVQREE